jgi:predicted AlkP superfamily phosphohydrolase/phosphomutase
MIRLRVPRLLALGAVALAASACSGGFRKTGRKLVVIGIDGMDPVLLRRFMDAGSMPNFQALANEGTFVPLGTSNPPQSPVAWSTFITGMDPGGHGVFDFVHRDPSTYAWLGCSELPDPDPSFLHDVLPHEIPLPAGKVYPLPPANVPMRKGRTFWDLLAEQGVRADVYRMPAAYPIQESVQRTFSDMGTPDLQGGIDGVYCWYTSDPPDSSVHVPEGQHRLVTIRDGRTTDAKLVGPPSPYERTPKGKSEPPKTERKFTVYVDPVEPVVHLEIEDGDSCVLEEGKWSEWLRCSFLLGPYTGHPFDWIAADGRIDGMVKFYLQQAHPDLRLYCSPVNIDPRAPCFPISTPDDEAVEDVCEAIGPFYTAGLAEETKGLENGVISDAEFLSQCDDVTAERLRMLDYALDEFEDGLLFFYFSSIDLRCHMMWRHIEPGHPARDEKLAASFGSSIEDAYVQMDRALGHVRERIGASTRIIVLSDHGFSPFTREVNLNRWLRDQGYLVLTPEAEKAEAEGGKGSYSMAGGGIDRSKTRAYAIGFNSLYLNLKGREKDGIVDPKDRVALCDEIRGKLLQLVDEDRGGAKVVRRVDRAEEIYHGDEVARAPDLIVGYDRPYCASTSDTAVGRFTPRLPVLQDNKDRWSGSHLMAPEVVPGVFLTNQKLTPENPSLVDVTATLLAFFGVEPSPQMRGRPLFGKE